MRALGLLALLAACGGGGDGASKLRISTSFTISSLDGTGPSVLDPLNGQVITLAVNMDGPAIYHDQVGSCRSTIFGRENPERTASGPMAALVQTEILDKIPIWDLKLELCTMPAGGRVAIDASINELNTAIGCLDLPASAQVKNGDNDPLLTTFVGTNCTATILDVVNNRVLGAQGFTVSFDTGGARLP
jgi:hypothetical protein